MVIAVAVLASLAFIGWLIYRGVKQKQVKAHAISYALASLAGIYTLAFFIEMAIPQLIKIVVSIVLGAALIVVAAYLQHRQPQKAK